MKIAMMHSPLGWLQLEERNGALAVLTVMTEGSPLAPETPLLRRACAQLEEYFSGRRREFELPLALDGLPPFRRHVLETLRHTVPFGKTVSYGQLAAICGSPGAARAVGSAMGQNPIPVILPCHRVLPASGRLGAYSAGGQENKELLLALERSPAPHCGPGGESPWLYHCSPTAGITLLTPAVPQYFDRPRQVCLTASLPMALLYGVRHFEYTYGYDQTGIYYEEYFPGALERLYAGKSASLYRCAFRPGMTGTKIPNEYVTNEPAEVEQEYHVPDLYRALLEQERLGTLRIFRYAALSAAEQGQIRRMETEQILSRGLLARPRLPIARYLRDTYPASWRDAEQKKA